MSELSTYNGWKNRETWLTSLWLNNDRGDYELLLRVLMLDKPELYKATKLKAILEDQVYDLELETSLWTDLLSTALAKVNWLEIIESNLE
jgi:ATP-dependent phosphoenolpyruvate carboxykinase